MGLADEEFLVAFAEGKVVQANGFGGRRHFNQVVNAFLFTGHLAGVRVGHPVPEGVDADLEAVFRVDAVICHGHNQYLRGSFLLYVSIITEPGKEEKTAL